MRYTIALVKSANSYTLCCDREGEEGNDAVVIYTHTRCVAPALEESNGRRGTARLSASCSDYFGSIQIFCDAVVAVAMLATIHMQIYGQLCG